MSFKTAILCSLDSMYRGDRRMEPQEKNTPIQSEEKIIEENEVEVSEEIVPTSIEATDSFSVIPGITQSLFNQLTTKNQTFMVAVHKQLANQLDTALSHQIYAEMVETLIDGQAHSQTARQIYGTPTDTADAILKQEYGEVEQNMERSPDWQIGLDGALMLGSIYTIITGVALTRGGDRIQAENYMGIISMIVNYIAAGFAILPSSKYLPDFDSKDKKKRGLGKYFLVSSLSMIGWFLVVTVTSIILPAAINPILPAKSYILIGLITIVTRYILKRRWNIQGTIF